MTASRSSTGLSLVALGLVALGLVALSAAPAHAGPGEATRLEYARSPDLAHCPDRSALKDAVRQRLGYDPFFPAARQTIVVAITSASPSELHAHMQLIDEQGLIAGARELHDKREHCEQLVAALALAISIALDPSAALNPSPEPNPPSPSVAAAADETPPLDVPPVIPPRPSRARRRPSREPGAARDGAASPSAVRFGAFSALGSAPALAFGARFGASSRWNYFQLTLELAYQFAASRASDDGARVESTLVTASLAPCLTRWSLAGCALLQVGTLQARGKNVEQPVTTSSPYSALGVRLEYAPTLVGHLQLLLGLDALKPLTPLTLRLRGEPVWQTPALAFALGAGLAVRFP